MLLGTPGVPLPPLGEHELLVFWVQVVVLLAAARLGGYALRRVGQPQVIGELLAGVALGPSLLGRVWPSGWDWLFPADDRQSGLLLGLAWLGIVLLLMTTGVETDLAAVRRQGRAAVTTAAGSLVVPLVAGVALGAGLPADFVGDGAGRGVFAVFVGIALAISSLPVAARILGELGLLRRPVGQLVVAVAMVNDVVGWLLLGLVAGLAENDSSALGDVVLAAVGVSAVALLTVGSGSRVLDGVVAVARRRGAGAAAWVSIAVLFTAAIGAITHALGLEVVIGAFLAGIAIGRSRLATERAVRHLEVVTSAVFAPLFFAVAGLRVDLRALGDPAVLWGAVVITAVATAGKLAGAYAGARVGGLGARVAFGAAAALNARGALEVVVATVGLSIGVLTRASYTAIVLMAIVTSAMTAPLLRRGLAQPVP